MPVSAAHHRPLSAPRQPSPRSFSTVSDDTDDSPALHYTPSIGASSTSSRIPFPEAASLTASPLPPQPSSLPDSPQVQDGAPPAAHAPVPTEPMPDSLLCRTSFAALEHSAGTLKRLSKHALASSATVMHLLEQLENAEDELLGSLGELGRWLEGGYGVRGQVWDQGGGVRKVAREKRARERQDLEAMVVHSLQAVKGEVKRQGLAGGGAQAKFEHVSKQYYSQTAAYLAPGGSAAPGTGAEAQADAAQAARQAQYDVVRYNHHSTLLYAVPPSSVGCLDLLVGLYGWVGAQLSSVPGKRADTHPPAAVSRLANEDFGKERDHATPTQRGRQLAASETPVRLLSRDDTSARVSVDALQRTLSLSLAHLVQVRGDLLFSWAARDQETTVLEDNARRLAEQAPEPGRLHNLPTAEPVKDVKVPRKRHKIHSSVGGKIRGLFTQSSAGALPTLAERAPPVSSKSPIIPSSRRSIDFSSRPPQRVSMDVSRTSHSARIPQDVQPHAAPAHSVFDLPDFPRPPSRPPRSDARPAMTSRHSVQIPRGAYKSPLSPPDEQPSLQRSASYGHGQSSRATAFAETSAKLNGGSPSLGGVGGLDGTGDEDEQREQVGRKREGVLFGTGVWEDLDKGGGRSKWERFWVVLAHSNIYEYRETGPGISASTVIDLKFASVREGRGTDRRFVFEIVTPSHGRRLYQATSEPEMRTWIYAICNAIESCINGTSTMRSSDLRNMSGGVETLDDYGQRKPAGAGGSKSSRSSDKRPLLPSPNPSQLSPSPNLGSRQSMPPPPRAETPEARHSRRTSLKNRFKSSNDARDQLTPHRYSQGLPPRGQSVYDGDAEIEQRVMEMAGLGLSPALSSNSPAFSSDSDAALPQTGGIGRSHAGATLQPTPEPWPPSPGQLVPAEPDDIQLDMAAVKRIADTGANARCADCGRRTKSSRWATLSLRDVPMVMFLCIRCCGLHRGLGTHISKPRSVDLDNWSPEAILLAHQWGNDRGNAIWERLKPRSLVPNDEDIGEYIQAKYVEARWVAPEDRAMFGLGA